jgi:cellulose synthase/poly-beta-1,6-N-acetylglucosamine synthase-like glycosyltransferase
MNHHKISILIAVRNEENTIQKCLESIEALKYKDSYEVEVLIGNDNSTDSSKNIIQNFIQNKSNFYLFDIQPSQNQNLRGKANVLAQLIQKSKGNFIFITDADTFVPTDWLQEFMFYFEKENPSIITGVTIPHNQSMQSLEWAEILGIIYLFAKQNIPLTSMGNNMAFEREKYNEIGGYENISFSLTEDFALFQAMIKKNGKFIQLYNKNVTAFTQPVSSLKMWFSQRKRWLYGAMSVNYFFSFLLILKAFSGIFIILLSFYHINFLWILLGIELLRAFFLFRNLQKIHQIKLFVYFPVLIVFQYIMLPVLFLNYFFIKKVVWKDRVYQ